MDMDEHGMKYIEIYTCIKSQMILVILIIEGSLEVKLPTIWTDGKAEVGRVREEKARFTVFSNDLGLRRVEK